MTTRQTTPRKTTAQKASTTVRRRRILRPSEHTIASVPSKEVLSRYVQRQVSAAQTEFDVFDFAFANALDVLIEGPTGPGKTMAVRAWCASRGKRLARIPSNVGLDPSQLFGRFIPDETGKTLGEWVDGSVTYVVRNGGAILVNEANFMPERVSTVFFGLMDDNREIVLLDHKNEVVRAHRPNGCWCDLPPKQCQEKWVLVVADMNPDYEGTRPLNKAFRNRFGIQLFFDYDPVIETKLVKSKELRDLARLLRSDAAKGVYDTPVSTNMLMEFEQVVDGLGYDFAVINFVNHFSIDERPSLNEVFKTVGVKLRMSFEKPVPKPPLSTKVPNVNDGDRLWKAGDYDAEWGVYGADWWFEEQDTKGGK